MRLRAVPVTEPGLGPNGRRGRGRVTPMAPLERIQHEVLVGSFVLAGLVLLAGAPRHAAGAQRRSATGRADDDPRRGLERPRPRPAVRSRAGARRADGPRRHARRPPGPNRGVAPARAAFASEVAHELRTPITALRVRAELALAAKGDESAHEREMALRSVVDDAVRVDRAIDALMAVARRELDPSAGSVDLTALVADIDGVDVRVDGTLPAAEGEPEVVRRALAPLVDNARRYAREQVVLELSSDAGRVRVAVRDDGPGLEPALAERAFDPGTRGPGDAGNGAGLGLPLARRLARSCGGDVTCGPGPGGCFVLELPAVGRQATL